jgi:3-deoxy-manno-octulosonate cytidylyltransferase (CMP-KDO synthetase)
MIIIPARLASTRFPRKILAPIHGVPMVIATAKQVSSIDKVAIATDSPEVVKIANDYGFEGVLTKESHQSGTDRIHEAAMILGLNEEEIVINVQGDEPFIEPEIVQALHHYVALHKKSPWLMASCCKKIDKSAIPDPNLVKVVMSETSQAIYFSRAPIPHARDGEGGRYFGHLGLYGFNVRSLKKFCSLPLSWLEECEKLEQLRALSNNLSIQMIEVASKSIGIDTPEDLNLALKLYPKK